MNLLQKTFSQSPLAHHAYGIEAHEISTYDLSSLVDRDTYSYIVEKEFDTFKIDDARTVKDLQNEKTDKDSLFVLRFFTITNEAQNALLKVLEEPRANTYFVLIFPNRKNLLVTLQSRLHIISPQETVSENEKFVSVEEYLNMNLFERFEYNKKYTDKKSKDIEVFAKQDIMQFLNQCENYLHNQKTSKDSNVLQEIFQLRDYINSKGASMKMILDQLAMLIQ